MRFRNWIRPPRHLLVLFFAVTGVATTALGWSTWRLVQQDRGLARQRAQEQRDHAATVAVVTLQRTIATLESRLTALASAPRGDLMTRLSGYAGSLPVDALLIAARAREVDAYPAGRLLYYPVLPPATEIPASVFESADEAEFQGNDFQTAISLLRTVAAAASPPIRAAGLVRIARNLRKSGRWEEAIAAYHELARMGDVAVNGVPAELVAQGAIGDVLADHDQRDRLISHARALDADLQRGKWRVLRPVYDVYCSAARRWLDEASREPSAAAVALSEAVLSIWSDSQPPEHGDGRRPRWIVGISVLVIERTAPDLRVALAMRSSLLESNLKAALAAEAPNARITLADADGRVIVGADVPDSDYAVRLGSATGLPWTVYASSGDPASGSFTLRSQVVLAGLSSIVLLVTGSSYLVGRAVMRELRVAQLQSDFVSAVSHEFRTPLTVLRQLSELLVQGRVPDEVVRRQYYDVLQHESRRLHRLVEGLLKFGRMQAEAMPFQFEPVEARAFVRDVVSDFQREAARQGYSVEVEAHGAAAFMSIDKEALACALWNLLDNAMKYSPEFRIIWVSIDCSADGVAIRVRDRGVGIAEADRARIFDKFVRGHAAASLGVPGSGIGLAVARQIVVRHGGDLTVQSEKGQGSTFTVIMPVVPAAIAGAAGSRRLGKSET
jgi:signal transduction histidine kinase